MKSLIALVGVVLALAASAARGQQVYESESKSWKFTCPEGWNQIAFDIIKAREEAERADWPEKNFKYIAAFTRGPMNTMSYPYILINKTEVDLTSVKYEDFEAAWAVRDDDESERAFDLLMFAANFGENGAVDRGRGRVVATYEDFDEKDQEFVITLYTYLGKTSSIQFECYDLKSNADANLKHFDEFVNSFEMREDLKFVPAEGKSRFDTGNYKAEPRSNGRTRGYGRYGFYGFGGIGAMVAILLIWLRKD